MPLRRPFGAPVGSSTGSLSTMVLAMPPTRLRVFPEHLGQAPVADREREFLAEHPCVSFKDAMKLFAFLGCGFEFKPEEHGLERVQTFQPVGDELCGADDFGERRL